ncbi:uncharacterized protein V1510DRAFT_323224 [Dipodascopsis tothii]|uniref:uncharacterized protein n=1 Tax=Dipodascopsis tothii TaxID=44089 RepID=UPI0034CF3D26
METYPEFEDYISALPKCEQHIHLEGTLQPERRWACSVANGIPPKDADGNVLTYEQMLKQYPEDYVFVEGQNGAQYLQEFLAVYYASMDVLITEDDFYNLGLDYIKRASAMNVRYVEAFFDPQAHTSRGVAFETVIKGLLRARAAAKDYNVVIELTLCILRDMSAEFALETVKASLPYKDDIIAVGLDSDEHMNPPEKFADAFLLARQSGYKITAHCDVEQLGCYDNIKYVATQLGGPREPVVVAPEDAPYYLLPTLPAGADRIDHGLDAADKDDLVNIIKTGNLGMTICPLGYSKHLGPSRVFPKFERLVRSGIAVTVNSDDPAYMVNWKSQIIAGVMKAGYSARDIYDFEKNGILMAWTHDVAFKKAFLAELDAVYTKFIGPL